MSVPLRPAHSLGLLFGFTALFSACKGPTSTRDEQWVVAAVQRGRYEAALERARILAEAAPADEGRRKLLAEAELAYLLDLGREEVFRGDLTRGLGYFERAAAQAPEHPTVSAWLRKTRAQLAEHWLDVAAFNTGPEHLHEAEAAYEKVLTYDPRNANARRGLAQVLLLKNYRGGMSKTYFDDGLASFRDLLLEQARRAFQASRRYAENEPAAARGEQVERLMAEERLASAKTLEESGLFFAARNEYRLVLLIDPTNAEGREGLDRMDRESRAARNLAEADMEIRRGALEAAEETLEETQNLTEAQVDDLSLLQSGIEERRTEDLYRSANSLAEDYRYPEAVAALDEVLARDPNYKDAARRKATLEEFIQLAEEFYAKALAATDEREAEEYLRAIHPVLYPEYKDVVARLEAIEARRKAAEAAPK